MITKTGSWLVVSTLAVAALWAAPAEADDPRDACYEEYNVCMERASWEPVDWIRDYSEQQCQGLLNYCLYTITCGDNVCDPYWEDSYYCPADCG